MKVLKRLSFGLFSLFLFLCLLYALAPRSALLLFWMERQGVFVVPSLVRDGLFLTEMEGVEISTSSGVMHLDSLEIGGDVVARCGQGWARISYLPFSEGMVSIKDLSGQCLRLTGLGRIEGQLRFKGRQGAFGQLRLSDVQTPVGIVNLLIDLDGRNFRFFSPEANFKGEGEIVWDTKKGLYYRIHRLF